MPIARDLPLLEMLGGTPLRELRNPGQPLRLLVPDQYLNDSRLGDPATEALAIQRLIALVQAEQSVEVIWEAAVARRVLKSPALHPLAGITFCLNNARHSFPEDHARAPRLTPNAARQSLLRHRLQLDTFSDCQLLLCVDHVRPSLPPDLYDPETATLLPEPDFEAFLDDLLSKQSAGALSGAGLNWRRISSAMILRELLENTADHATTDSSGQPIAPNCLRGLIIKRVVQRRLTNDPKASADAEFPSLEFTVFDSGIGFYNSYRRHLFRGLPAGAQTSIGDKPWHILQDTALGPEVTLDTERAVVLKCLERHADLSIPDARLAHRGLGLYEVLRSLQSINGFIEIRTGRLHVYRSFLEGELKTLIEPVDSLRPGKPKVSFLDFANPKFVKLTPHELLPGSVVRIVVPLP